MRGLVLGLFLIAAQGAVAGNMPVCADRNGQPMKDFNNEQVLNWKTSTKNQYLDRGYIRGTLVGELKGNPTHDHLDVFLGETPSGRGRDSDIEIVYNVEFGAIRKPLPTGAEVIACGDYITSNAPAGHYDASPVGAIIHWVHKRMGGNHLDGFLIIDGEIYGQADAPPRHHFDDALFDDMFGWILN